MSRYQSFLRQVCLLTAAVEGIACYQSISFVYHHQDALETILNETATNYPDIAHMYSIGTSVNGTALWVIALGENVRQHISLRPDVKLIGNIHGNEVVGRELLLHLVAYLTMNYGNNDTVTDFLRTTRIHILPSMNPDGFQTAQGTEGECRGNYGRFNLNDFDLNRNFPDLFEDNDIARQPETKAVMKWLTEYTFVMSVSLHGGALVTSYPYDNYASAKTNVGKYSRSPDDDIFINMSRTYSDSHPVMKKIRQCQRYNFTDGITNGAAWYPLTGGMQDYNYDKGCMEITIEVSCCKYPPENTLETFWQQNRESLLELLKKSHIGIKGVVTSAKNSSHAVPGARIQIEGRDRAIVSSNTLGEFWRLVLPGVYNMVVSATGYKAINRTVRVSSDVAVTVNVSLVPSSVTNERTSAGTRMSYIVLYLIPILYTSL